MIVSKFGGSSVSDPEQIQKVRDIVAGDSDRKYVVVSAPGKSKGDDYKVTDSLFNIATHGKHLEKNNVSVAQSRAFVLGKFSRIVNGLGLDGKIMQEIHNALVSCRDVDYMASLGEYFNAKLVAEFFRKSGLEAKVALPEENQLFVTNKSLNAHFTPAGFEQMKKLSAFSGIVVVPGYYGITEKGEVRVFSRGGSDLTGGDLAFGVGADLYENWTDRDGVFQVDPRIIPTSKPIPELTYREIRILASRGFEVFHYEAMLRCRQADIPIVIKNTNNPFAPGTRVVDERVPDENETVVGIAKLDNLACIRIYKDMMDEEVGFTDTVLDIFRAEKVSTHHYPTDVDELVIVANQKDLEKKLPKLVHSIRALDATVSTDLDYAILAPTGVGMRNRPGVLARCAQTLADAGVNIDFVTQTPSQTSIILGVKQYEAERGLKALYENLLR